MKSLIVYYIFLDVLPAFVCFVFKCCLTESSMSPTNPLYENNGSVRMKEALVNNHRLQTFCRWRVLTIQIDMAGC